MATSTHGLVILAAGRGVRFVGETHKLRALLRGRPVLGHVIDAALRSAAGPVAVVSGAVDIADLLPDGVTELHNPRWAEGQSTSLQAGRAWSEREGFSAFVVGLGDQPFVPSSAWAAVAGAGSELATATFDGKRRPPVRIGRSMWSELPVAGDIGAREFLQARAGLVAEIPCGGHAADIDTREDLELWN